MNAELSSKLAQVIEQIPKDVLYDFCCSYAQEFPFRKGTKGYVHFFGAKKRNQRNIPPPSKFDFVFLHHDSEKSKQASLFSRCSIGSPYIGRMQLTPVRDQPLSEFWYDLRSLCPSGKS